MHYNIDKSHTPKCAKLDHFWQCPKLTFWGSNFVGRFLQYIEVLHQQGVNRYQKFTQFPVEINWKIKRAQSRITQYGYLCLLKNFWAKKSIFLAQINQFLCARQLSLMIIFDLTNCWPDHKLSRVKNGQKMAKKECQKEPKLA